MAAPFGFGFVPAGGADCCTCEGADCITDRSCCNHVMPIGWVAEIPALESLGIPSTCDDCCDNIGGTYKLIPPSRTDVWHATYNELGEETGGSWEQTATNDSGTLEGGGGYCQWVTFQYLEELSSNLRYRLLEKLCASNGSVVGVDCDFDDYYYDRFGVLGPNEVPIVTMRTECMYRPEFMEERQRIVVWVAVGHVRGGGIGEPAILFEYVIWGEYSTGWITEAALETLIDDAVTDPDLNPITLDLETYTGADYSEPTSPSGCSFPASITVTPDVEANNRVYNGCDNQCPPPFDDGPHGILIWDGDIGSTAVTVCLVRSWDDTLGSLKWEGTPAAVAASCGTKATTIRIYCGYLDPEDEQRQWLWQIVNGTDSLTNTFALAIDANGDASISETLSAYCDDAVVATVTPCTTANAEDCCPSGDIETDCCPGFPIPASAALTVLPDTYEPEVTVSVSDFVNTGGTGTDSWDATVTVENVSNGGGIDCTFDIAFECVDNGVDDPFFRLTVDGVAYTEADGLEVQCPTEGVDGYVRLADATVCTSILISLIEIELPA